MTASGTPWQGRPLCSSLLAWSYKKGSNIGHRHDELKTFNESTWSWWFRLVRTTDDDSGTVSNCVACSFLALSILVISSLNVWALNRHSVAIKGTQRPCLTLRLMLMCASAPGLQGTASPRGGACGRSGFTFHVTFPDRRLHHPWPDFSFRLCDDLAFSGA